MSLQKLAAILGGILILFSALRLLHPAPEWTRALPDYSQFDDQSRSAEADFAAARDHAAALGKPILMIVGGPWCGWCRALDDTLNDHPALAQQVIRDYVVLHVYEGEGGHNSAFLDRLPQFPGVPWLFIFDPQGRLMISQDASELLGSFSYDPDRIAAFASTHARPPSGG